MDDTQRTLRIRIGSKTYPAAPFNEAQAVALQLVKTLPPEAQLRVISGTLRSSLGDDAHTDLTVAMASGELSLKDWINALERIAKKTGEAKGTELKDAAKELGDVGDQLTPSDGSA